MAATTGKKKIFDGRYDIISIVGRGSRSVVYQASNINDGNTSVALKVLVENKKDTTALSEKLRREALALVSCHHPYVIRLDDFHSVGDICYLAMEYAAEADLRKYITKQGGSLPVAVLQNYLKQAAEGLDYIHRTGIIHRDIKPDNLLVVSEKEIRIGDFGVAFLPGDNNNASELRNAVGTFDYMAPEVLQGIEYTPRSDIYSLGISFYEALTGKNPFETAPMSGQLDARKNLPAVSSIRTDVPAALSAILEKACAYDASQRYATAKDLLNALKILDGKPAAASQTAAETSTKDSYDLAEKPTPSEKPAENRPQLTVIPGNAGAKAEAVADQPPISEQENMATSSAAKDIFSPDPSSAANAFALKDSRSSRTQTVFISKESVKQVRDQVQPTSRPAKPRMDRAPLMPANLDIQKYIAAATQKIGALSNASLFGIGLCCLLVIYFLMGSGTSRSAEMARVDSAILAEQADDMPNVPATTASSVDIKKSAVVPAYTGQQLAFPSLPSGIYSGVITGIIGNAPTPMTIMSADKHGKLIFMLGVDGVNPAVVTLNDSNRNNQTIKLVANGLILELTGTVDGDTISGSVKNVGTGSVGSFRLRPSA